MCWGVEVSATFCVIYAAFAVYTYWWKPIQYRAYIMCGTFFFFMELFQLVQWIWGDVVSTVENASGCSHRNKWFTFLGYILVWGQPLLFASCGYVGYKNKLFKRITILITIIVVANTLVTVYITLFGISQLGITPQETSGYKIQPNSITGPVSCTFIGPNHHLAWMWRTVHPDMSGNIQTFLVLNVISFMFYKKDMWGISIGWLGTMLFTAIFFNSSWTEFPAFWCYLSVTSNLMGLGYQLLYIKYFKGKEEIELANVLEISSDILNLDSYSKNNEKKTN